MLGWLAQLTNSSTNDVATDSDESFVEKLLQTTQSERCILTVRMHGEDTSYNSTLLEIDTRNKTFLIDELFPPDNSTYPDEGKKVHITSRIKGSHIDFDCYILKHGKADVLLLQFPEKIIQEQRRSKHRANVDSNSHPRVTLITNTGDHLTGQLIDISSQGFGAAFQSNARLEKGMVIEDCSIQIKNEMIHTAIAIRNTNIDYHLKKLRVGSSFPRLPESSRKKIEKIGLLLQRSQLQKRNALTRSDKKASGNTEHQEIP